MQTEHPALERALRVAIIAASLLVCGLFLFIALRRLSYPYELEELEGYMLLMVRRIAGGFSMYPRPSLHFIPDMYTPLYFYAAAAMSKLTGAGFVALRLTSILATLATFILIYLMVWREVRQKLPALAAVGVYAALYPQCEAWFDRGRLDSFFILTIAAALYSTRYLHPSVAGLAWTASFLTKQSILPAAILILCFDFPRRSRTAVGLATFAVSAGASVLWLQHATQGWFWFYAFTVPGANADILVRSVLEFWTVEVCRPLGLALLVMFAAWFFTAPSLKNPRTRFYLFSLSIFLVFWFVCSHAGSSINAAMPVYALAAILFGVSFGRLSGWMEGQSGDRWRVATACLFAACLIQIAGGISNPGRFRTNPAEAADIATTIRAIQAVPGQVYVVEHPYYGVLAGKEPFADLVSIHDASRPENRDVREELRAQIAEALAHNFSAVVLDSEHEDIDRLNAALALDPSWQNRFTRPVLIQGSNPRFRPAWIMTAVRPADSSQ